MTPPQLIVNRQVFLFAQNGFSVKMNCRSLLSYNGWMPGEKKRFEQSVFF